MTRKLGSLYVRSHPRTEQRLRKSNSTEEGGLPETSRLAPGVSGSVRTSPFLSERHKPDSPQTGERVARDVVRRRWTRTTHDMEYLGGFERDEPASRATTATSSVRTPENVHPRPINHFEGGRAKTARRSAVLSTLVRASTPILYCCDSRQECESEHNVFNKERIRNQGGRLDAPCRESPTVQRFSPVHPRNRRLDGMDERSGEVTL
jgi:hypothetical protein